MRLTPSIAAIALFGIVVSGAAAKMEPPPEGEWRLSPTAVTYEGPRTAVRVTLGRLIGSRASIAVKCNEHLCTGGMTLWTGAGQARIVRLAPVGGRYSGWISIPTTLRCGGRKLQAALTVIVQPGPDLAGRTEAFIANPGRCRLFRGKAWGIRRVSFVGISANG